MIAKYRHSVRLIVLCCSLFLFSGLKAQNTGTTEQQLNSLLLNAREARNQNDLDKALEILDQAANLAEENEDEKFLVDAFHQFSRIYLDLDKEVTALFYWDRASVLLENLAYPRGMAVHRFVEAQMLTMDGNYFQSIFKLNQAKESSNDRNLLNHITLLEAENLRQIEKYDASETNYNSLLVNNDPIEKEWLQTQAHLGLAELNLLRDRPEDAISNAREALNLANNSGFSTQSWEANQMLARIYEESGDMGGALRHTQYLMRLRDSVYNVEKFAAETSTADKVQIDYMLKEVERLETRNRQLGESANRSELTAILTSAFLIIISLLAVSLYRNNQIKLKTNDLLQTKNRELQYARDAAVQAMEAKTNFLSTVSHELRTPLYAVTGLTHLLLDENPTKAQEEHLKALKFSGDYLLNFINDILQINKIDADKLEPLEMEFNLKKVLTEVINSLQQTSKESRTQLILDYDKEIPNQLLSDPVKLSQIFMNLVGNALKFTKDGEVLVFAKLLEKTEESARVFFEVRDTGIGIDEEQQKHIFDSFEQGSIQINREYGGTGLGLTITKSLLGLFGSKIQLESTLGEGSSFFFELDFKRKDSLTDDISFQLEEKDYDYDNLYLLIVEDNKINQVITKKMLSKKGIESDIANNGTEAIELASKNNYDGILMDIHMPGISGVEATQEIRKFDPNIPIIALTAISLDDSLEAFYAAGCNDVVTKPFKPELFYQKIGENIVDHKSRKSLNA
ncbi:Signal transduction histidine kinase [Robiginitalea myxolifaciens]|uniref:histidine kinase n=1 Tax=Robiginitalea myxolifaciens TaxID=400055 RepID=A0A1I6FPR6_9FLAO|nr:response regulator [Robiginitalea myxolifaciens]SFR31874.1 Signal transduction histidine kinase [Robiginitalea myxolifaciens]